MMTATATASRTLKVARWVSDLEAGKKQACDDCSSISPTEAETNETNETVVETNETNETDVGTNETDEREVVTNETEVEGPNETGVETNESGTESVRRRNPPTHNKQAGSKSVESVVMAEEEERVTVDLETESRETTNADSSRDEELTTGDCQVDKSNQAKEVSQSGLEMNLQTEIGEYLEPEGEIKSEEESEYQEGPIAEAAEVKEICISHGRNKDQRGR